MISLGGIGKALKKGWDAVRGVGGDIAKGLDRTDNEFRGVDPHGVLGQQSQYAGSFADRGELDFDRRGGGMDEAAGHLGRIMRGEQSLSAEQLRQAAEQNMAQQQAMAQSGRGNPALAARMAAQNTASINQGLAGQQAMAGIAERQAAAQGLGGLLGQARDQDLRAALGGRELAIRGQTAIEGERGRRFGAISGVPTPTETWLGAIQGAGQAALMAGGSDKTIKLGVENDPGGADQLIRALQPKSFERKPGTLETMSPAGVELAAPGGPRELGVVAQDLEGTPAGRAIVERGPGDVRVVNLPKLTTGLAGAVGRLGERLEEVEERPGGWEQFRGRLDEARAREKGGSLQDLGARLREARMREDLRARRSRFDLDVGPAEVRPLPRPDEFDLDIGPVEVRPRGTPIPQAAMNMFPSLRSTRNPRAFREDDPTSSYGSYSYRLGAY